MSQTRSRPESYASGRGGLEGEGSLLFGMYLDFAFLMRVITTTKLRTQAEGGDAEMVAGVRLKPGLAFVMDSPNGAVCCSTPQTLSR
jgi:hypothetical protein